MVWRHIHLNNGKHGETKAGSVVRRNSALDYTDPPQPLWTGSTEFIKYTDSTQTTVLDLEPQKGGILTMPVLLPPLAHSHQWLDPCRVFCTLLILQLPSLYLWKQQRSKEKNLILLNIYHSATCGTSGGNWTVINAIGTFKKTHREEAIKW